MQHHKPVYYVLLNLARGSACNYSNVFPSGGCLIMWKTICLLGYIISYPGGAMCTSEIGASIDKMWMHAEYYIGSTAMAGVVCRLFFYNSGVELSKLRSRFESDQHSLFFFVDQSNFKTPLYNVPEGVSNDQLIDLLLFLDFDSIYFYDFRCVEIQV